MAQGTDQLDRRKAERIALVSLGAALFLVTIKLAAGLASGSLAVLGEALHSAVDAAGTGLAYVAVRIASRPPDSEHPYGHGKAESIFALFETVVLFGFSFFIAWEALRRLAMGNEVNAAWYTFAVIGTSIAVDVSRAIVLKRAGRKYRSPALLADSLHFTADLFTSTAVLVGLLFVRLGFPIADAIGGLLVAGFVAVASFGLGRRAVDVLMDRMPGGASQTIIAAASSVPGVTEVRRARLRYSGGQPLADLVVAVSRTVPLEKAHAVSDQVEDAVRAVAAGADVVVHVEPIADEERIAEQVMSIAAREGDVAEVHNVQVTVGGDGLSITLHAKFPADMPLGEAHSISERLESEISREIEQVARVDTHLEPLDDHRMSGVDVTSLNTTLVSWAKALAERQSQVERCHEVVVTSSDAGLLVVMHCEAPVGMPIAETHEASTLIESELHARWPEVARVTVHFEPTTADSPRRG